MEDQNSKLKIRTMDGKRFRLKTNVAAKFGTIRQMIDSGCTRDGAEISFPVVAGKEFSKAISWAIMHSKANVDTAELKVFDSEYLRLVDQYDLHNLFLAADYLDCPGILDLCAAEVASMIRGKKAEEIRQIFGIVNDFAPGEEEAIKQKNPWAFE